MKRLLIYLLNMCALSSTAAAHVLDQYLQVAQIALAPDSVRVELRLIPGVEVAKGICRLIDADGNGEVTTGEEQAYARRVLQDLLLTVNGISTPLSLREMQFPTQPEMRAGLGTIRLTLTAATSLNAATQQQIVFRNNHLPELGVYLVNALIPTAKEIQIAGQTRDPVQREMQLVFHHTAGSTSMSQRWLVVLMLCLCLLLLAPHWKHLRKYLSGCDHKQI